MTDRELEERVKGALYGFVIGDAMGATTEFKQAKDIARFYGQLTEIIGGGWLNLKPGLATDDTDMMLCVANAIIDGGNEMDMLNKCCINFVEWFKTNPIDVGNTCREVISMCSKSNDHNIWTRVAQNPESLGNGSLMRTLPCILLGHSEVFSIMQGRLTHNNDECDYVISQYHRMVLNAIRRENVKNTSTYLDKPDPTGRATNSYKCAEYWITKTDTFEDAILGAVNDGGDADTIAAITGSIAGAYYGFNEIPKRWILQLDESVVEKVEKIFKIFKEKYVHVLQSIV